MEWLIGISVVLNILLLIALLVMTIAYFVRCSDVELWKELHDREHGRYNSMVIQLQKFDNIKIDYIYSDTVQLTVEPPKD